MAEVDREHGGNWKGERRSDHCNTGSPQMAEGNGTETMQTPAGRWKKKVELMEENRQKSKQGEIDRKLSNIKKYKQNQ